MEKSITFDLDALKSHAQKCVTPGMGLEMPSGISPLTLAEAFDSMYTLFGPENSEFVGAMSAAITLLESIHNESLHEAGEDTDDV